MSVLIKGITKPTDCILCPMFNGAWQMCELLYREVIPYGTHKDCPMVELPPHGRLIDADALVEDLKRQCEEVFKIDAVSPDDFWITRDQAYNERLWKTWCESFFEYLKTRETIIPESEEG